MLVDYFKLYTFYFNFHLNQEFKNQNTIASLLRSTGNSFLVSPFFLYIPSIFYLFFYFFLEQTLTQESDYNGTDMTP